MATLTILVVDDDQPTLDLYARVLNTEYRVFTCTNETDACAVLDREHVGLVLLEPAMPGERGWHLLTMLRANHRTRLLPIILCSTMDERSRGAALDATAYLIKPVLPTLLRETVQRYTTVASHP